MNEYANRTVEHLQELQVRAHLYGLQMLQRTHTTIQ